MSDIPIHILSDSESEVSSAAGIGVSPDSPALSLAHDRMGPEILSLINDSNSEKVYEDSLNEKASFLDSFEAILLDDDVEEGHPAAHMPSSILSDAKT